MPEPGAVIADRWLLGEELGGGGFATVFRGSRVSDGLPGAVKVILPHKSGSARETVARFGREVEALARINEPHIVRLLDHGKTASGLLFLVSELVEGEDLSEVIARRAPLEPSIVRHVLMQLLRALGAAHRAGLLHRDIKPANIRIQANDADPWRVKLLDFGIARDERLESDGKLTATGVLIGTPRYMSPEQLRAAPLSAASDLYSLGVVAFEMLSGAHQMHGGSLGEQLQRIVDQNSMQLPPTVDPGLRYVVDSLLRPAPADRMQSAEAVLRALESGPPRAGRASPQACCGRAVFPVGLSRSRFSSRSCSVSSGWFASSKRQSRNRQHDDLLWHVSAPCRSQRRPMTRRRRGLT